MKKCLYAALLFLCLLTIVSASSWAALTVPSVTQEKGTVGGTIIFGGGGLDVDWNYGLSDELGVKLELGLDGGYELGVKYELNQTAAVVGGVFNNFPYIGIMGSAVLGNNLSGLGEFSVIAASDVVFHYELGFKHNLDKQLALRFGLLGFADNAGGVTWGQLGILYYY